MRIVRWQMACRRSAPIREAPERSAELITAPARCALLRSTERRSASTRSAPARSAPDRISYPFPSTPREYGLEPPKDSRRRHDPPNRPRKCLRRQRPRRGGRDISHRWVGLSGQTRYPSGGCHLAGPVGSRSASRAGRVGGERRDCALRKVFRPPVSGVSPLFGGRRSASRQLFRTRPLSVRTRKGPRRSGGLITRSGEQPRYP